jgi:hypothetical protein
MKLFRLVTPQGKELALSKNWKSAKRRANAEGPIHGWPVKLHWRHMAGWQDFSRVLADGTEILEPRT